MSQNVKLIGASELAALLTHGDEVALLDVREEGVKSRDGHIILSAAMPLSQIELRAWTLLPRLNVRIVLTDAGDGDLVRRAATKFLELGYTNVAILNGGVAAWQASGHEIYTGQGVYSKAFGEFVEQAYGTPHIPASELKVLLDNAADVVVLDGRTLPEFEEFSIPGAHAVPNAELPYRVHSLVQSSETLVVVNCAGRTRSIIGAQALINAGLPNKVVALENGTMAWLSLGETLQSGTVNSAPPPVGEARARVLASVELLTRRFNLQWIDASSLHAFRSQAGERTLYLLDVRTKVEFEAGHVAGGRWAEGGQLIQAVDRYMPVRNARIVVLDNPDGARAAITASWLVQLGWGEVYAFASALIEEEGEGVSRLPPVPDFTAISPADLQAILPSGAWVVLDLSPSTTYESEHIPGARFAVRSRLGEGLDNLGLKNVILVSPDGLLAGYAALELTKKLGSGRVRVLAGGMRGWRQAGLVVEASAPVYHHAPDDVWRSPYQQTGDREAAFRSYLGWEADLLVQSGRDPLVQFKVF